MNHRPAISKFQISEAIPYDVEEFSALAVDNFDLVQIPVWENSLKPGSWLALEPGKIGDLGFPLVWKLEYASIADALLAEDDFVGPANSNEPLVEVDRDGQLALPICVTFTPSEQLLRSWKENASAFADRKVFADANARDASIEFSFMLKRLVGSIAQERRAAGISRMVIVDRNGDFDPDFQLDVSERFLLLPQKASQFFAMLHRDFLAHPGRTIFSGAWGTMLIDGHNEIALDLNSPRQVVREGFVKAVETR